MRSPARKSGAAVLVGVAISAGGCGSSPSLDRPHFLARANAICSHFSSLQNQVQFPSTNPVAAGTSHAARAEWGVAVKQVAYLGTQETKALQKLEPPAELARRFTALVGVENAAYAALLRAADAAKRNDPALVRTAAKSGRAKLARASAQAKAMGLGSCR